MTSSPCLRMKTSEVENWKSLGRRTAWLRLFMKILAVRGILASGDGIYMSICHLTGTFKRLLLGCGVGGGAVGDLVGDDPGHRLAVDGEGHDFSEGAVAL